MFGFPVSAWTRATVGLGFAAAAAGLVWLIEREDSTGLPAAREETAKSAEKTSVSIESTQPIGQWEVLHDGSAVGGNGDATHWQGRVPASGELVVIATPSTKGPMALRLTVGQRPAVVVWGSTARVDL